MPIFTAQEYDDFDERPDLDDAWPRLPVLARWDGLRIRYLGPLVDLDLTEWMEDLSHANYNVFAWSRWVERVGEAGPPEGPGGGMRRTWLKTFGEVVRDFAYQAGFEHDPDVVASWVAWELADTHALVKQRAARRDALR